jgi:hypothetical protein
VQQFRTQEAAAFPGKGKLPEAEAELTFIYFFTFLILNYEVEDINGFKLEKTACHL